MHGGPDLAGIMADHPGEASTERKRSMSLATETCEACLPTSPKVTDDERRELSPQIPDWDEIEASGVPRLRRTFRFDGWMPAVAFTNRVAALAEDQGHHPLIRLEWGKVTVSWWTHAIKGLHRNDYVMAARTDTLANQTDEDDA
jgi:4a-hydroxytetrahydrobiopterin dehydratase